ncbi:TIR domain-containing protein [Ktedonosporobacter rubrisoli]|uniref:TIR domain-containing protein n=1 Tax=Ktedonosporobacter rubrisoli TaxID=2509675 RepID=A0A4P6JSR3_KTERU|nr:TIR domain-containing protein [Ktedonosporobacter rubrisoli]QBD78587.1 TIR domain-containing protein [Ktedonosporobacter rubrisoli]
MMASIKLVYSCAPDDYRLLEKLSSHLHPLVSKGWLSEWHEQLIPAGTDRALERRQAWSSADILLLLLSADYFKSEDYNSPEMLQAFQRQQLGQLLIVPVLVRPCAWETTEVAHLQCLPRNKKPVILWENQDAALLTVAQELQQFLPARRSPGASHLSSLEHTNRARLLKHVRTLWIEGLLAQSLQNAVWVDLHLQKQTDALENPWRLVVQELEHKPRPLPAGTSIVQVFDEADEELLILGEPGSGKTTLLLYLARTLLDRAESNEGRRMPVIFHLSSWAQQRCPLDQWLVEELKTKYQVPQQLGRVWIETDKIFPLLDGLDEVEETARNACVEAIIAYMHRATVQTPLVVCCRNDEYQALTVQLPLQYAVMLLPLTNEQIDTYLSSISGQIEILRQAFNEDRDLLELARRPLLLSIFTLAYQGATSIDLPATHQEYPQALFRYYVKHMLSRRARLHRGTAAQMQGWLTYLARQLHNQQQTILAIEDLQPAWLSAWARRWYRWGMAITYGLVFGLVFGPIFGATFGCAYWLIHRSVANPLFGLIFGLTVGCIGGLVGGLAFGIIFKQQRIVPAEVASWSGAAAWKGLKLGLAGGLIVGAAGGLAGGIVVGLPGGITLGLAAALLVGLVGGAIGGLSPKQLPERLSLAPNEGIWRSGRRGFLLAGSCVALFGIAGGLIFGLYGASIATLAYAPLFGIVLGASGGLIFGLAFGLVGGRTGIAAFLQHFVLRFFLCYSGLLPWNLSAFLDEATERLLLRKVGGNYIFVHRLLRDVLASTREASTRAEKREK